jgi:hypothetical protein
LREEARLIHVLQPLQLPQLWRQRARQFQSPKIPVKRSIDARRFIRSSETKTVRQIANASLSVISLLIIPV